MLATLSGCGLAEVERARMETGDVARQVSALRGSGASAPGAPQAGPRLSTVRLVERRPYVGLTPIEPDPRADLPARYRHADAVTLPFAGIGAAATLAGRIEAATGLAVRFTGPARQAGNSTKGDPSVNVFGEAVRDGLSPDGGIWTGPLDALLDSWTEPSGYEWRYDADRQAIEIVRRRSAIFQIHALAGKQHYTVSSSTQDSAAGGDGEGSGGGNLTSQTISTETDYDPWPEIEGQLKGLLDPGTRLSVAPSSASVTVSGTPRDIARARAYLGYLNREVLRPVTLSVHVYSVRVEREADYDLGLSFSIARLLGEALRVSVGSNAVALIKPSPGGKSGDTLSATVKALSSAGAVSQEHAAAFETTLAGGHTIVLTPAGLRALGTAPPGLPDAPGRNATFFLGVISDGTTRGIPMAFGVLEPSLDGGAAHGVSIREGALAAGLAALDSVGSGALMAPHLPAIEAALGRSLGPGALFVTADHGLRYLEQALYRRAQPGRAYLNRLETGLDMSSADPANPAGRNIVAAGTVTGRAAYLSGDAQIGGNAVADDSITAQRLATADLSARELGGAALSVSADLIVGHAVTGAVATDSVKVAGRLDAGGLNTAGTLSARTLSAATAVAVAGEAAVTGTFDGEETSVSGALQAGGIAARAAHGPQARIDGLMTVGSCGGC